jgi:hypothetical protein
MLNSEERTPLRLTTLGARVVASLLRLGVVKTETLILLGAVLIAVPLATTEASGAQTYKDRRVIDVLKDFERQGVRLIFSTRLVRPDMWVIDEPRGAEARQIITAILAPHGLATRVGPRGVLMVIRASVAGDVIQSGSVVLASNKSLSGLVRDKVTSRSVAAATVRIARLPLSVVTDEAGAFRLDNVPNGTHLMVIDAHGYSRQTLTINIGPEREARFTIDLVVEPHKEAVLQHQAH